MDTRDLEGDDSDSSDDETASAKTLSTQEHARSPSERHAFLFRHNLSLSAPDLNEFHPLPSQIPFLLDVFSENVNFVVRCVHMPSVTKMIRNSRGNGMRLTPANEALMFSIYYAAIISMEDEDVSSFSIVMPRLLISVKNDTLITFCAGHDELWLLQSRSRSQVSARP